MANIPTNPKKSNRPTNVKPAVSMSVPSSGNARGNTGGTGNGNRMKPARAVANVVRHAARQPRYVEIRQEKKSPFPIAIVAFLAVVTVLFLFMMMNYAEIDKYNAAVTELQNEVAQLQAEHKKLDLRLENKDPVGGGVAR